MEATGFDTFWVLAGAALPWAHLPAGHTCIRWQVLLKTGFSHGIYVEWRSF